jgi:hypothetical protein
MYTLFRLAAILVLFIFPVTQSSAAAQSSDGIPVHSIPQNSPCNDQPKSLKELTKVFDKSRTPSPQELTGTWVQVAEFGETPTLNCSGLKRGPKLEWVMIAKGYSLQLSVIGTHFQTTKIKADDAGSVWFPVDFDGDDTPIYKCRITQRKTLACLESVYREGKAIKDLPLNGEGCEFKKMSVKQDEIYKLDPSGELKSK